MTTTPRRGPEQSPPDPRPDPAVLRRWRRHLADERAEAAVYRDLARRRTGEEQEILLALADAEGRHAAHWEELLGEHVGKPRRGNLRFRILALLARRFGSVFVLALAQRAEARATYEVDVDATPTMAADERIHEEVVRALAIRGRNRISGTFRAAVFGANDGLVSNLALVVGVAAAGTPHATVLLTGLAGLLAGALSMGAGEFISVRSQRELLAASRPGAAADAALAHLDVDANELSLVYRARGMAADEAKTRADAVLRDIAILQGGSSHRARLIGSADGAPGAPDGTATGGPTPDNTTPGGGTPDSTATGGRTPDSTTLGGGTPEGPGAQSAAAHDEHEVVGTDVGAALSSFCFFASGALIPVLPFLLGLEGAVAVAVAVIAVSVALLLTGAVVGLISGGPPVRRALRQLAIGLGAAVVTYGLGSIFGGTLG